MMWFVSCTKDHKMKTEFQKELERQAGTSLKTVPITNSKYVKPVLNFNRLQTNVWANTIMEKPKI